MGRILQYQFKFEDGSEWNYSLAFDEAHRFLPLSTEEAKPWTRLDFHQCPNCPLSVDEFSQCPVARNLDRVVEDSKSTISITRAVVTVTSPERSYWKKCNTHEGLQSLFGVIMASSGCPHLDWLRPLARFHLPFSDTDETLFRVLSVQLLHQFLKAETAEPKTAAGEVQRRYQEVQQVNHAFIKRIRSYCQADADKNAIAALDVFVQMFQFHEAGQFNSLRAFFD